MLNQYAVLEFSLALHPKTGESRLQANVRLGKDVCIFLIDKRAKFSPVPGSVWFVQVSRVLWVDPHPHHRFRLVAVMPIVCVAVDGELKLTFTKRGNEWISACGADGCILNFVASTPSAELMEHLGKERTWQCLIERILGFAEETGVIRIEVLPFRRILSGQELEREHELVTAATLYELAEAEARERKRREFEALDPDLRERLLKLEKNERLMGI